VIEIQWIFKCTPQTSSVFDVAVVVADPRVEDVAQRVFPEKCITEYAHAISDHLVGPELA